jgi:hypothetical protein
MSASNHAGALAGLAFSPNGTFVDGSVALRNKTPTPAR